MVDADYRDRFKLPEALLCSTERVILASLSPRRRELFGALGLPFETRGAEIEEIQAPGEDPEAMARRLSTRKAESVAQENPLAWVIGADTVVVGMGRVLGKPRMEGEAAAMLRLLSGRTHRVLTGVALLHGQRGLCTGFVECTRVTFRHLRWSEIEAYVGTGAPMDKAGAYGIQEQAGCFIRDIEGSYTNVVGLPMERLRELFIRVLGRAVPAQGLPGQNPLAIRDRTVVASEVGNLRRKRE